MSCRSRATISSTPSAAWLWADRWRRNSPHDSSNSLWAALGILFSFSLESVESSPSKWQRLSMEPKQQDPSNVEKFPGVVDEPPLRLPPENLEAEQALLGSILVNNAAYHRVSEFLKG